MSGESRLRKYLLHNIDDRGHFSQVEAHASQPGIPDLAYTIKGKNGWLELKYGTKAKPPELRTSQWVWFRRNVKAGGRPLIFCCADYEHHKIFGLIRGQDIERIYLKKSLKPWNQAMSLSWEDRVDWDVLTEALYFPERLTLIA